MVSFKKHSVASIFENNWPKLQTKAWRIKKNAMLNESSRAISQLNYSGSFPELAPFGPQLRVPTSKSSIAILHSDIMWLFFFKKIKVKKHILNNYEFYMNLTSKTPSKVRMLIKGSFPIETSGLLFVFHNLMYSRLIGLVENFNPKNKEFFKGSNENSENGY